MTDMCANYLCDNDADGRPDRLCGPCRACERLVLAVNAAVETFLSDRIAVRDYDRDSATAAEISEADTHLTQGLIRLLEMALGKRVFMTSGPWVDLDRWRGGLGWDISEYQDDDAEVVS
jgi:hypothetical protein